ncbi:hypothetical protein A3C37_02960 [Candidatus Peribacteria bacterium RIFCSPHIGHO2_02_FULL_53_20]|nr:MAG: hypothetical protein A3C37_02960 [Candidatus Peribacteria bacterium RIFCSPHIGHO2_02_FULL_53_20]
MFAVSDSLIEGSLAFQELILLLDIFLCVDGALQLHIEKLLQFFLDLLFLFHKTANGFPTGCVGLSLFFIELAEHVLRPVVGQ